MATVGDFIEPDDFEGQEVEEVNFVQGDNDRVAIWMRLENGVSFTVNFDVDNLKNSDYYDIPDDTLIDGIPITEWC